MTKYISLGRHCDTTFNIRKFISGQKEPTDFFDWIRVEFKCILDILNVTNIDTMFNKENIIVDKKCYQHEGEFLMLLKNFEHKRLSCLFHHDIKHGDYDDKEMNERLEEFIDKYKRRHHRLIETIKTNKNLVFIYRATTGNFITSDFTNEKDINDFKESILSINKDSNFYLVILVNTNEDFVFIKEPHFLKINISGLIDPNIKGDWTTPQINWAEIFSIIQRNINF